MRHKPLIAAALLMAAPACSPRSLVGVDELASDETLATELIEIRLKAPSDDDAAYRLLRISITPDNVLRASRVVVRYSNDRLALPKGQEEMARETTLSKDRAMEMRRALAILRPAKLGPDWPFAFLTDCPGMSSHPDNVLVVSFSKDGGEGGLFLLERSCKTDRAVRALKVVDDLRAGLPIQVKFPQLATT